MAALRLDSVDDMGELKLAYRERMRALHPDVNARDTTAEAAQVNLAYAELAQALVTDSLPSASRLRRDVFDTPGPAECCFVNPFTYGCDPIMWRELQGEFKQRQSDGLADEDILLQLRLAGAGSGGAGVVYLSADQLAEVEALMATLDETFDYSTVSWLLGDCLLRACRANERF